jgi:hypothetical protein
MPAINSRYGHHSNWRHPAAHCPLPTSPPFSFRPLRLRCNISISRGCRGTWNVRRRHKKATLTCGSRCAPLPRGYPPLFVSAQGAPPTLRKRCGMRSNACTRSAHCRIGYEIQKQVVWGGVNVRTHFLELSDLSYRSHLRVCRIIRMLVALHRWIRRAAWLRGVCGANIRRPSAVLAGCVVGALWRHV